MGADYVANISFVLDESIDMTCDDTKHASEQRVKLKAVKLNGEPVSDDDLIPGNDGDIEEVALSQFKKGDHLSFDYDVPGLGTINEVVLRAEIVRRRLKTP